MWIHWIMVRKWYWQDEPYGPMKSIISECAHQPQLATAAGKLSGSDQIHHCTCCPGQPRFPAANVPFFPREIVKFLPGLRPAAIGVPKIKTLKSKIQIHSANKTVLYPPPRSCRVTCYPQNCESRILKPSNAPTWNSHILTISVTVKARWIAGTCDPLSYAVWSIASVGITEFHWNLRLSIKELSQRPTDRVGQRGEPFTPIQACPFLKNFSRRWSSQT